MTIRRTSWRMIPYWLPVMILSLTIADQAQAGSWADGYGPTVEEAVGDAVANAQAFVRARGEGCFGGNQGGPDVRVLSFDRESGTFRAQAFYSHHAGSCDRRGGLDLQALGTLIDHLEREWAANRTPPEPEPPHDPAVLRQLREGFRASYSPSPMQVGHPSVVSVRLERDLISNAADGLFNDDRPAFLRVQLVGARLFLIDELDAPVRKLTKQSSQSWEWIVEPEAEGESLPLALRVFAFSGSVDQPVDEIDVLKEVARIAANKTLFDTFTAWLTSAAGLVTSTGVILGGMIGAIGYVRSRS